MKIFKSLALTGTAALVLAACGSDKEQPKPTAPIANEVTAQTQEPDFSNRMKANIAGAREIVTNFEKAFKNDPQVLRDLDNDPNNPAQIGLKNKLSYVIYLFNKYQQLNAPNAVRNAVDVNSTKAAVVNSWIDLSLDLTAARAKYEYATRLDNIRKSIDQNAGLPFATRAPNNDNEKAFQDRLQRSKNDLLNVTKSLQQFQTADLEKARSLQGKLDSDLTNLEKSISDINTRATNIAHAENIPIPQQQKPAQPQQNQGQGAKVENQAKTAGANVEGAAAQGAQKTKQELNQGAQKTEQGANQAGQKIEQGANQAAQKTEQGVNKAAEKTGEAANTAAEKMKEAASKAKEKIKEATTTQPTTKPAE